MSDAGRSAPGADSSALMASRAGSGSGASALAASPAAVRMVAALRRRSWTVAVAESLTAGLVTDALVRVPGASAVLRGGVTAYAADVKVGVLGVPGDLVARDGVVTGHVARAMARGACALLHADVGIATTGVAGPGPADGVPTGTVVLAVVWPDGEATRTWRLAGPRPALRASAASLAVALADGVLGG